MTQSFTLKVADYFKARPGVWLDGNELATVGGCYAWRSRISDCRKLGMTVDNRQRKVGPRTISEYRYQPQTLLELMREAS